MATTDLTGDNFEEVINKNDFVIIDFWAPWCGPCQGFASVYTDSSEKHSDIVFAKVNTEDQQELGAHFNIRSIPTLMIFREQVILYSEAGAMQASEFEKLIDQARAIDMKDVHQQMAEKESKATS